MDAKRGNWWAVVIVTVAVMLMAYVGSYLVLMSKTTYASGTEAARVCRYRWCRWMTPLYKPLAVVEAALTGDDIYLFRPID